MVDGGEPAELLFSITKIMGRPIDMELYLSRDKPRVLQKRFKLSNDEVAGQL